MTETILPGVTAIKTGGHFDGSLVLHWEEKLFIADTLVTAPVCHPLTYTYTWSKSLHVEYSLRSISKIGSQGHRHSRSCGQFPI